MQGFDKLKGADLFGFFAVMPCAAIGRGGHVTVVGLVNTAFDDLARNDAAVGAADGLAASVASCGCLRCVHAY